MNEPETNEPQANEPQANEPDADSAAARQQGAESKPRQRYDAGTSEATREMRDTSRRRRDAEGKLQQHLLEAKDHVPHHHEQDEQDAQPGQAEAAEGPDAGKRPGVEPGAKDTEGDTD
ncbi:hypothetical protein [Arthrobacter sp. 754]|uniref:hypothetical protein n=1 Tax=Arthrobacter sp. 754 TaxID=3156315 RepID=UPI003396008B